MLVLWLNIIVQPAWSQINTQLPVSSIEFIGLENIPKKEIPKNEDLLTKIGKRVTIKELNTDIENLFLLGYFSEITAFTKDLENSVSLHFKFKANPRISTIAFKGNKVLSETLLLSSIYSKKNDLLNLHTLEKDKEIIKDLYKEKGYDLFKLRKIELSEKNTLTFYLNEGVIGSVYIEGLSTLKPNFVLRELDSKKGTIFNSKKIQKDRERLLRQGYYSDVSNPRISEMKDGSFDLELTVSEKKSNNISFGVEHEENKFLSFLQFTNNHFIIPSDFISAKTQVGTSEKNNIINVNSYSLTYSQPWIGNKYPFSTSFSVWKRLQKEELASTQTVSEKTILDTQRLGNNFILSYPIIRDIITISGRYKYELVSPKKTHSFTSYKINSIAGILEYRTKNNHFNPKNGSYLNIEYERGGDPYITHADSLNFNRVLLQASHFIEINSKTVFALNASMGLFETRNKSNTFESENFIIGGTYSLRGYNEYDFPFSGKKKIVYNIEYRYDISPKIQTVFFIDLGKTLEEKSAWNFFDSLKKGQGVGIRFFTPVGPLGFDFSVGENDSYIHIRLGQMF
jgi:outer membrane protein insertion porin family